MNVEEAMETLTAYLERQGLKLTPQRRLITALFFDPAFKDHHPSADELVQRVAARDPSIGFATVYRTIKILVESRLATPHRLADNLTRYEPNRPGEHHDHLVCTRCGRILEFEDDRIERLQEEVARLYGFVLQSHRMVLYGAPVRSCGAPDCEGPQSEPEVSP